MKSHRLLIHAALLLALGFFALPAWFALVNSFKPLDEIYGGNVFGLPGTWTLEAWGKAWNQACTGAAECRGLSGYFVNSLLTVLPATAIGTMWGCWNGYILAKWRFKGSEAILFVLMFGSFIPIGLFLFPLTVIFDRLGLSSSLAGLIVVYVIYSLPTALFFNAEDQRTHFGRDAVAQYLAGTEGRLMRSLKSLLGSPLLMDKTEVNHRLVSFQDIVATFLATLRERATQALGIATPLALLTPEHEH